MCRQLVASSVSVVDIVQHHCFSQLEVHQQLLQTARPRVMSRAREQTSESSGPQMEGTCVLYRLQWRMSSDVNDDLTHKDFVIVHG